MLAAEGALSIRNQGETVMSSSSSTQKNHTSNVAAAQKLKDGFDKHLAGLGTIVFGAKTWTPADVGTTIQSLVDAHNAAEAARGAFHDAVGVAEKARADARQLLILIRQMAHMRFANQAEVLADFGLTPKTVRTRKVKDKLAAVEKGQSTRVARSTKGPRQRAQIKGEAAPPAPALTPTPALAPTPAAPPGTNPSGGSHA
jgi:hypothetical protein